MLLRARLAARNMPATRSSTRSISASPVKRKLESPEVTNSPKKLKPSPKPPVIPANGTTSTEPDFIPADAVLTFSFEDAKNHLINADHRFEDVFNRLQCTPFQKLEQLHPFRALATSILGQQISVMAARSIKHKFIRLYDSSIPEKYLDYTPNESESFFPTPQQVAETDMATLRTAGLSARKRLKIGRIQSVLPVPQRMHVKQRVIQSPISLPDSRTVVCQPKKLMEADDEELAEMLIAVRGIGRWTVDMFALFSLRRPDILPVGDLGVQRGVVRWFLSQHVPSYSFTASPEKNQLASPSKKKVKTVQEEDDALPVFGEPSSTAAEETPRTPPPAEDASAIPLPPTFTPSIKRTLAKPALDDGIPALPEGLTVAELKSRLDGKKKSTLTRGAFLSPLHMEQLTAPWRPYRSLGVYYMWALADAELF
ncbi:DNA glycosylase [Mycena sanguinolenta]|uniref:DNA glycosylase n=1 Tax=Mycena sanguinolenta TaxID=230812 RepID=A0A8H6ZF06_9AGAR|nr:DNA glycosylase [Mycena sanguinolenta]